MIKNAFLGLLLFALSSAALAFNFVDVNGHHHDLAQYKGKWVLVNFWATWCPPCRREIPDLIALAKHDSKDLVILGVAMDYQDPKQVVRFAASEGINYPIILGTDEVTDQIGQVSGLPTSYLYDPQGKMVAFNVGALSREALEHYIAMKSKEAK